MLNSIISLPLLAAAAAEIAESDRCLDVEIRHKAAIPQEEPLEDRTIVMERLVQLSGTAEGTAARSCSSSCGWQDLTRNQYNQ